MKKFFVYVLLCTALFTLPLMGCTPKPNEDGASPIVSKENRWFPEGTEISLMISSHAATPYNENWPVWRYIQDATGAKLNITAVPNEEYKTKIALMMASRSAMTDLIHCESRFTAGEYVNSGAMLPIDDYIEDMPNYTAFWNSLPEEERNYRLMRVRSSDGKTYLTPNYGTDAYQSVRGWLYRKDVFEKHGLKPPETMDELFETAKKLKKIYPNSYPVCMRSAFQNISLIAPQWKPNLNFEVYYDSTAQKFSYGVTEPVFLEVVNYLIRLRKEGLIPPDYITLDGKTWEELVSTDRGFIFPDYIVRVDFFNIPVRKSNPDFTLTAMKPPRANVPTGQSLVGKFNVDLTCMSLLDTGNPQRIKNAVHYIDWLYTDEAAELCGWGRKNESYQIVDGKKQFIRDEERVESKYGLFTRGTFMRVDPEAASAIASGEQAKATAVAMKYLENQYNPLYWLPFSDEAEKELTDLSDLINTFARENLSKFLCGQRPISEWDSFVQEIREMGIDRLLGMYEEAYRAVQSR